MFNAEKVNSKREQRIDIHYRFVGLISYTIGVLVRKKQNNPLIYTDPMGYLIHNDKKLIDDERRTTAFLTGEFYKAKAIIDDVD